jgi:hypothetical protein
MPAMRGNGLVLRVWLVHGARLVCRMTFVPLAQGAESGFEVAVLPSRWK